MQTNPKEIEINGWTLLRRSATRVEAICPHGVGHHKGVHGCHLLPGSKGMGCCSNCPPKIWEQVTEDRK